jgi:AraC-like DNA-binding protein
MDLAPDTSLPEFFSLHIAEARRFYRDCEPTKSGPLTVVSGGCEYCAPHYEIHRSTFPYFGIEFVAQGQGTLEIGAKKFGLVAGTLFAYGPGISQDIVTDKKEKLVKYFVDFTGKDAPRMLEEFGPKPGQVIQTSAPNEVLAIFDSLIRNGLGSTAYTHRISAAILQHLLLKIAETTIPFGSYSTPAFATYRRCRKWIDDHYLKLNTLEQIAEECHIDPAYLCRLFRRFDHLSPYQVLVHLKMTFAAERLQTSNVSIKQLAADLGFGDPFHFSRVFKKARGISPAKFVSVSHRGNA